MTRIAVLGAGGHSRREHGPALKTLKEEPGESVELSAVCDLEESKAAAYAREFSFARSYTDLEAMLEIEKPEGLIAITPIVLTEPLVRTLLPRRIPLLIEKPPGEDSEATRRLLKIARGTGTRHMISFNRRFCPAIEKARQWLDQHAAERPPHLILGRMLRPKRREANFAVGTGIHLIDCVLSFLGKPERVVTQRRPGPVEGAFSFTASAEFPAGAGALFVISPETGVHEETYEIHGQGYCIQVDAFRCLIRVFEGNSEAFTWQAPQDSGVELLSGTTGETRAFIRHLQNETEMSPTLEDGLVSMLVAEATQEGEVQALLD